MGAGKIGVGWKYPIRAGVKREPSQFGTSKSGVTEESDTTDGAAREGGGERQRGRSRAAVDEKYLYATVDRIGSRSPRHKHPSLYIGFPRLSK